MKTAGNIPRRARRSAAFAFFALSLSLCVYVHAQKTSLKQTPAKPAELQLWQAISAYGSETPQNPLPQGFFELGSLLNTLDGWRANMFGPRNEKANWMHFRNTLEDADMAAFLRTQDDYSSLTTDAAQQHIKRVGFAGRWLPDEADTQDMQYRFSMRPPETLTALQHQAIGAFNGTVALQGGSHADDNLLLDADLRMQFGSMLVSEILLSIEYFLQALERVHADSPLPNLHAPETEDAERLWSSHDEAMLRTLRQSFPHSMATLERFSRFRQLVKRVPGPDGKSITKIQYRQTLDLDAMSEHFADTYDDFAILIKRMSFQSDLITREGLRFARVHYDGERRELGFDVLLSDGALVMFDAAMQATTHTIRPSTIAALDYEVRSHMQLSLFGLEVDVSDVLVHGAYRAGRQADTHQRKTRLNLSMSDLPVIETRGAFLYVFPTWLIDLLIPGSIETLILDSFEHIVQGNHGAGLVMNFLFHERASADTQTNTALQHEVSMSGQMELPYEVLQSLLEVKRDSDDSDEQRLFRTLRHNLRSDFAEHALRFGDARIEGYALEYLPTMQVE